MSPKKKSGLFKKIAVGEDFRIAVNQRLRDFNHSQEEKEYEFPSSFSSDERCYVHRLALQMGLQSKSRGKGINRYLTVFKKEGSTILQSEANIGLNATSRMMAANMLTQIPVTNKERMDLLPPTERERHSYGTNESRDMCRAMGKLNSGIPQIPPENGCDPQSPEQKWRQDLPIFAHRAELLQAVMMNQVILVTGDTGSGKTTQVPQYILEHAAETRSPCRIVCTEPRRLAAVAVAERVASERNEKIGETVGFQIRLESRVSLKTLLTFCTNGVLLRTLMGGDSSLAAITHVIVDEIHERDRFSDFLLTVLREALTKFRGIKVILMSATVDMQLFLNYFPGAKHISIPGRMFPVKEIYLETILKDINYSTPAMDKMKREGKVSQNREQVLAELTKGLSLDTTSRPESEIKILQGDDDVVVENYELSEELRAKTDSVISKAFLQGDDEAFEELLDIVINAGVPIDYQHSQTGVTALMAAAGRGKISALEQILAFGPDISIKASNQWNAKNFANFQGEKEASDVLEAYKSSLDCMSAKGYDALQEDESISDIAEEEKALLTLYHNSFDDDLIDYDLIVKVIKHIQNTSEVNGSILVFLAGYEDIITIKDLLTDVPGLLVLTVHSQMGSMDQKRIFNPAPSGLRKVVLATNIAETSITIDDVVFVLDTGKVKEKCYDAMTNISMLRMVWISRTSATQRRGRAGRCRPGVCFRLYSSARFQHFSEFQTPEILRTPLMELCLHTKLLAPPNMPIADFLVRAPQAPSFMVTRNAVQMLKTIEALDAWEDVTELGNHLLDLPVEPKLGKMVLYSVVLKCLDPVLTIVCCAAYKDPFVLPVARLQKQLAKTSRSNFSCGTYSDHMALLRAFQGWQRAKSEGTEKSFCYNNQISPSIMEMVTGMRTQLLGQLRASGFVRSKGLGDIRDLNKNSENWAVVKAALTAGNYPNIARYDRDAGKLRSQKESKVVFHPGSVLGDVANAMKRSSRTKNSLKMPTDWFIFDEMTRAGHLAMIRGVTAVSPVTVLLFAGPNRLPVQAVSEADAAMQGNPYLEETSDSEVEEKTEGENTTLRIDDWTVFRSGADLAHLALQLRQKWSALLLRRLGAPAKPMSQTDQIVLDTVVNILSTEETALGLMQPTGVGQRPKQLPCDAVCTTPTGEGRASSGYSCRRGPSGGAFRGGSGGNRVGMQQPLYQRGSYR